MTHRLKERSLAFCLGAALAFGVVETSLRAAGEVFWIRQDRPKEGWIARSSPDMDCKQCVKILAAGDSYTWGFGAPPGFDYPALLASLLNARGDGGTRYAVINAGRLAANSTMIREALDHYLEKVTPDIVTIMAGGSNAFNFYHYYSYAYGGPVVRWIEETLNGIRTLRLARFFASRPDSPSEMVEWLYASMEAADRTGADRYREWRSKQRRVADRPAPESGPAYFLEQGLALLRDGEDEEAISHFKDRINAGAQDPGFYWGIGFANLRLRRYGDAITAFQRSISAARGDPAGWCGLGEAYARRWAFGEGGGPGNGRRLRSDSNDARYAAGAFQSGITANPGYSCNHCGLGNLYAQALDRRSALTQLKKGIASNPGDERCYPALIDLSQLLGLQDETADYIEQVAGDNAVAAQHAAELRSDRRSASAWLRSDLEAMVKAARSKGAKVLFIEYPLANGANAVMSALASERSIPIVHTQQIFDARISAGTAQSDLFVPDLHCSANGNQLVARSALTQVLDSGLVATASPPGK